MKKGKKQNKNKKTGRQTISGKVPSYDGGVHLFVEVLFNVVVLQTINGGVAPQLLKLLLYGEVDSLVMVKDDLLLVRLPYHTQDFLVELL